MYLFLYHQHKLRIISFIMLVASYAIRAQEIQEAIVGQFPYVVLIYNRFLPDGSTQLCTGSLIKRSTVLTSARCVQRPGNKVHESLTFAGIVDQSDFRNDTIFYNKRFTISMNRYTDFTVIDDVALLFTSKMDVGGAIDVGTLSASKLITGKCVALGFSPKIGIEDFDKVLFYLEVNSNDVLVGSVLDYEVTLPGEASFLNDGALGAPLICSGKIVGILSQVDTKSMLYTSVAKHYGWVHGILENGNQIELNVTERISYGNSIGVNVILFCIQGIVHISRIFSL